MNTTNSIFVDYNNNYTFILYDPDTKKTIKIDTSELIGSSMFVDSSFIRYFLGLFPGKTECVLTKNAQEEVQCLADWNYYYE